MVKGKERELISWIVGQPLGELFQFHLTDAGNAEALGLINSARVSKRNKARELQQPLNTEAKIEKLEKISKQFSKLMDKQIDELRSKTKKL